jgi:hypothetical protein
MICNSLLTHGRCDLLVEVQRGLQRASCCHVAHFCLVALLDAGEVRIQIHWQRYRLLRWQDV